MTTIKTDMKRRAIVMGATSGIGQEVARQLAVKGYEVGIAGRRTERLAEMAQSTPGIVAYRQIDVTRDDAPEELQKLISELGGMDLYFHSSGIGWENVLLDTEKEMKTVETNGVGFVRMVTAAFNWFAENRNGCNAACGDNSKTTSNNARIACITSIARTRGLGAAPAYSATKRMQAHYLECLSQQARMRRLPISITDIRPGFVATDLSAGSHFPLQLNAEDVARTIVRAIERGSEVVTIDWRYRLLVAAWQLIPRWLWVRLTVVK